MASMARLLQPFSRLMSSRHRRLQLLVCFADYCSLFGHSERRSSCWSFLVWIRQPMCIVYRVLVNVNRNVVLKRRGFETLVVDFHLKYVTLKTILRLSPSNFSMSHWTLDTVFRIAAFVVYCLTDLFLWLWSGVCLGQTRKGRGLEPLADETCFLARGLAKSLKRNISAACFARGRFCKVWMMILLKI